MAEGGRLPPDSARVVPDDRRGGAPGGRLLTDRVARVRRSRRCQPETGSVWETESVWM